MIGRTEPAGQGVARGAQTAAGCRVLEQEVQNVVARSTAWRTRVVSHGASPTARPRTSPSA
jgi:hypothetical protein